MKTNAKEAKKALDIADRFDQLANKIEGGMGLNLLSTPLMHLGLAAAFFGISKGDTTIASLLGLTGKELQSLEHDYDKLLKKAVDIIEQKAREQEDRAAALLNPT